MAGTEHVPSCSDPDCLERAQVLASRSSRSQAFPVCDRHAHVAALQGERHGFPVLLTALSAPPAAHGA